MSIEPFENLPRAKAPPPLHMAFRGLLADGLRRIAQARQETPQALAAAIVARALQDGSAEETLGEDRAETLAGGHGRRPFDGVGALTLQQCAVLYLVGAHGGQRTWCGWSAAALARLMPGTVSETYVTTVVAALARKRLIERTPQLGRAPRRMRLTELGKAVWAELSGDFDG